MVNPIEKTALVTKDPLTDKPVLVIEKLEKPLAQQVRSLNHELDSAIHAFGLSGLRVGEILARAQALLEPLGLFVAWVNSHPGFSTTTAYRLIAQYSASEKLPTPVIEIAMTTGMQIVGTTEKKPYGRYTASVERVGPPPAKATTEEAGMWLQRVSHTYNTLRLAARGAIPSTDEAIASVLKVVVRVGNKLPSPDERGKFIYGVIDQAMTALGIKATEVPVLKKRGRPPRARVAA